MNYRIVKSAPLTSVLIIISIIVSLWSGFGEDIKQISLLFISQFVVMSDTILYRGDLHDVMSGEVWRLVTPIFIHFGLLHLVFNLLWLWDLGRAIELREGTRLLLSYIVFIAIASNLAQFYASGPSFGGMSGVVYGLLSYLAIRGALDKHYGIVLHKPVVVFMLAWFVACWVGLIPNVANVAHTLGLVAGCILGGVMTLYTSRTRA